MTEPWSIIKAYAIEVLHDVYGSVLHNTNLIEMTNKMQLCRKIYYFIVPLILPLCNAVK